MKTSSTSLLGEKSRGLLQNLALLPKNLTLLAHAGEFLGNILMQTLEQICLLVVGSPPTQRRFRDAEIICNCSTLRPLLLVSRTAPRLNSSVKRLCLFPLMATSSILPRGWLSTFAGQVHKFNARVLLTNRTGHSTGAMCRLAEIAATVV
jgi:hypothetical protein